MNELERVKQKYEEYISYAEKWLRKYKETKEEIFKIGFELNMMQAGVYIEFCGIEPDSRYLEMQEEWETLK